LLKGKTTMHNLQFKEFLEGHILNAPGRAGQHVWKPEGSSLNADVPQIEPSDKKTHLKGVHLNAGFKPKYPAPFKGLTADKFGIKVSKVAKPNQS